MRGRQKSSGEADSVSYGAGFMVGGITAVLGLLVFLAAEQCHTGGCLPRFSSLGGAGGVRASPGTLTEGTHWPNLASKSGGTA